MSTNDPELTNADADIRAALAQQDIQPHADWWAQQMEDDRAQELEDYEALPKA